MINAGLGAALNIGLNLILIPRLGIEGSALDPWLRSSTFCHIFYHTEKYGHSVNLGISYLSH